LTYSAETITDGTFIEMLGDLTVQFSYSSKILALPRKEILIASFQEIAEIGMMLNGV
jgi:hypothetical protein